MYIHIHTFIVKYFNISSAEFDRVRKTEINGMEDLNIITNKLDLVHTLNSVSD